MTSLLVRLQPNAKKNEIVGFQGDVLKIRIHAPPVDGAANEELIEFLAEVLDVKRRDIQIASGEKSKEKRIEIQGRTRIEIEQIINSHLTNGS